MGIYDIFNELMQTGNKCVYCGREIKSGALMCSDCAAGEKSLRNRRGLVSGSLRRGPGDDVLFAFRYDGVVRKLIHRFKYQDMPRLAPFMAERMEEYLRLAGVCLMPSIITFVPIHESRMRQRGFDQSELLATHLGLRLEMQSVRLLERTRPTDPQYDLSAGQRADNVAGAFKFAGDTDVRGKNILLIDDIYTTGATANECAAQLAGANIQVFAYARDF